MGDVYGLPRHLFEEEAIAVWAERRGVLVKSIEDAALATASVYRGVGVALPEQLPLADGKLLGQFQDLLARFMPFDLVIDEQTSDGEKAMVSKTSVCGSWGAVAGTLRYFADKFGVSRASIEGTQLAVPMLRRYAKRGESTITYDANRKHAPLAITRRVEYFGFDLERETERLDEFPADVAELARRAIAESLARQEARHHAVKLNRAGIEEVRELWRRSGGRTPKLGLSELAGLYEQQLREADVSSMDAFHAASLRLDFNGWVSEADRDQLAALPDRVDIRGRPVPIDYDVEEVAASGADRSPYTDGTPEHPPKQLIGVARLRLPEKLARTMAAEEVPVLDRPMRFIVTRGQRGAVRANTIGELQEILDRPWSPEEAMPARVRHGGSPKSGRKKRGSPGGRRRRG